ncbi:WD repeat-containing protein 89-like [Pollicipes pollicipes]|uniref:WD repeat-containing protein 89-like n=1 Tax=Pollicipes pollicipes TaxID=41117 RepID=UPI0018859127|nr:WD repeat-containing protein 89-like [Pollicipes pollicipes]
MEGDLNCRDIESEKDRDAVEYEVIQKDFTHEYSAASTTSLAADGGKRSTYITHLAANGSHSQLTAACSDNALAVFDWSTLQTITHLRGHTAKITGARYVPGEDAVVVSSSLDGTVRQWDTRTGRATLQHTDATLQKPKPLTCVDVNAAGRFVCAGTEVVQDDSFLVFWDVRQPNPLGGYWESHTDDVSTVRFHPTDSGALVSGSTDGYVNVFDVTQTTEDDALQATLNTESSVSSVTWWERAGRRHLAVVLDTEELQSWDIEESERRGQFGRSDIAAAIRRTMYEVCYVEGCHQTASGDVLAVAGAVTKEGHGCLRLLRLGDSGLEPHALLDDGEDPAQLVRASVYCPATGALVTGGEGGVLTLWKPGAQPSGSNRRQSKAVHHRRSRHKQKPY